MIEFWKRAWERNKRPRRRGWRRRTTTSTQRTSCRCGRLEGQTRVSPLIASAVLPSHLRVQTQCNTARWRRVLCRPIERGLLRCGPCEGQPRVFDPTVQFHSRTCPRGPTRWRFFTCTFAVPLTGGPSCTEFYRVSSRGLKGGNNNTAKTTGKNGESRRLVTFNSQPPSAFFTPTLSPARFSTPTRKFAITSAAIDERPLAKKQTQPEPSHGPTHSPVLANWTAASSAFLDCSLTQSRIGVVVLIGSRGRRLCGAPTRTEDAKRLPFTAELQPQQTPSGDVTNGSGNSPVA